MQVSDDNVCWHAHMYTCTHHCTTHTHTCANTHKHVIWYTVPRMYNIAIFPTKTSDWYVTLAIHLHCTQHTHTQLQFEKGDLVTVTKMIDGGWWEGVCNGKVGWFPGNYVEDFHGGRCMAEFSKLEGGKLNLGCRLEIPGTPPSIWNTA